MIQRNASSNPETIPLTVINNPCESAPRSRSITDRIDVAFLIGHPVEDHQYFQQALRMDELFDVATVFPMNREGEAYRCHEYAELLAESDVGSTVIVAETRGDLFTLER